MDITIPTGRRYCLSNISFNSLAIKLPVEPDFPIFLDFILGQRLQAYATWCLFSIRIYFSYDLFSLVDIHKASEEIANVNNTKIEKIRLHLIEVWLCSHYLLECLKEMVGSTDEYSYSLNDYSISGCDRLINFYFVNEIIKLTCWPGF